MNFRGVVLVFVLIFLSGLSSVSLQSQLLDFVFTEILPDTISISDLPSSKVVSKDTARMIKRYIRKGDEIYYDELKRYDLAVLQYQEAVNLGSDNQHLLFHIGRSYYKLKKYKQAKLFFEKMIFVDSIENNEAIYIYARLNHLDYKFDTAIYYYEEYLKTLSPEELSEKREEIAKKKKECSYGKKYVSNPVHAYIDILGTEINTNYVEYGPLASLNDSLLIFTSRRPGKKDKIRDHMGRYFDKIYFSVKDSVGNWSQAELMPKSINTEEHSAAAGLSVDGKKFIIYKSENNGDLFVCNYKNGDWSKGKKLKGSINTNSHEATASYSYDRLTMYFASNRKGGFGNHDIYIAKVDENGKWGEPDNLNALINSSFDEISMVALPDGITYYFTSNGHSSMGGYDIFKTTFINGKWDAPTNLGYPINTTGDDILYSVSANGDFAYVASSRNDSSMHDIYKITFANPIKPLFDDIDGIMLMVSKHGAVLPECDGPKNIKKLDLTVLKGTIFDQFSKDPLFAKIELTDNSTNNIIATFTSNKQTGNYLVSLPTGKDYGITVKVDGYLFHSENVTINTEEGYNEIVKNIPLNMIAVGSKVVLNNLFFETGKAEISSSSKTELYNLLKLMNQVPSLKLEIAGHTDSVGKAIKNKSLSKKRAEAVVVYLIKNGISTERLIAKGYGEDKPVASNKTKEGRQKNRRTEFEVIAR